MRFTDLNSRQRSMLTMLCTGQTFDTAQLGRGTIPKLDAPAAAQLLMEMRELGLVFSSQKPAGVQYANWRASDYGKQVFESRPEDVPVTHPVAVAAPVVAKAAPQYQYVVYKASMTAGCSSFQSQHTTEPEALAAAQKLAEVNKGDFHVAKLFAVVRPVVQPTTVIERV